MQFGTASTGLQRPLLPFIFFLLFQISLGHNTSVLFGHQCGAAGCPVHRRACLHSGGMRLVVRRAVRWHRRVHFGARRHSSLLLFAVSPGRAVYSKKRFALCFVGVLFASKFPTRGCTSVRTAVLCLEGCVQLCYLIFDLLCSVCFCVKRSHARAALQSDGGARSVLCCFGGRKGSPSVASKLFW
ncbi:hypothetical protein VPH35_044123 [Triticum aestivum]